MSLSGQLNLMQLMMNDILREQRDLRTFLRESLACMAKRLDEIPALSKKVVSLACCSHRNLTRSSV